MGVCEQTITLADHHVEVVVIPGRKRRVDHHLCSTNRRTHDLPIKKLHGFFSMVQGVKTLHGETMNAMNGAYQKCFMKALIPFASDVERRGVNRAPVMATMPKSAASKAFQALYEEMMQKRRWVRVSVTTGQVVARLLAFRASLVMEGCHRVGTLLCQSCLESAPTMICIKFWWQKPVNLPTLTAGQQMRWPCAASVTPVFFRRTGVTSCPQAKRRQCRRARSS